MEKFKKYKGLTDQEVLLSRNKFGSNLLTPPKRESLFKLFLEKFEDPIIRILLIAAFLSLGISFVNKEFAETIGIFCAIFLATGVAFWFEMDANKKFDILNQVNDDTLIKVIRNGNMCEVPKKDLVVNDIVFLSIGEEVPADGELLESVALQVDESCLTGELLIEKTTDPSLFNKDATYLSNWLLRGTKVMDGHCVFVVKRVGDETEYGKVAEKATEMSGEETPLNQQLDKLAKLIGVVGLGLAAFTFIARFLKDAIWGDAYYTLTQFGLLSGVIISLMIMLIKVWLPIIYDGYELAGKEKEVPKSVDEGSWFKWIGIGILTFIIYVALGYPFGVNPFLKESWISLNTAGLILQYFMVSVTLIVVAVPEGLPMSVTLSLALSMRKMLKANNLVRKMHACETVGATTVICTDKTGTLTKNRMQIHTANFFGLNGNKISDNDLSNIIKESLSINSTAHLDYSDSNKIKPIGNPTEASLLLWLSSNGVNYLDIRENAEIIEQLTFSTERKFMATVVTSSLINKKILYVKGAPEIVYSKCKNVLFEKETKTVEESNDYVNNLLTQYQDQAMRTLGFAYEIINDDKDKFEYGDLVNTNLTFLGVVAISDPVREDVPMAVKNCLKAGIDVKIVTGDTPGTAKEVARQIGIWNGNEGNENICTGMEFSLLTDEEASEKLSSLKIMCRARPADKQRLVQLLQKSGSVVAVTGDGTNDAPALNHAHVGLSMGSGTSVAKEASDITLIDDSFSSINNAVLWGRTIFQNIQRFIVFQLTINVAALVIDFIGAIFWGKLPLTVIQLLWINLIMDTFAAGALASLPADPKVMNDKPRDRYAFIVNKEMFRFIFGVGILFVFLLLGLLYYFTVTDYFSLGGQGLNNKELTVFFTFFVMLQFWNMFNAKAFFTGKSAFKGLNKCVGFLIVGFAIIMGQILIVEFGGDVFRTVPLSFNEWLVIIGSTSLVLWIGEILRLFKKEQLEAKVS
ncbi:MAG: calcium-translocating P-type ATPase, PMCA-type [Ignavibacteria bacterium]